jgi:hypothetical protein
MKYVFVELFVLSMQNSPNDYNSYSRVEFKIKRTQRYQTLNIAHKWLTSLWNYAAMIYMYVHSFIRIFRLVPFFKNKNKTINKIASILLCCVVLCCVVVWCGVVWCGVVWCGVMWFCVLCCVVFFLCCVVSCCVIKQH